MRFELSDALIDDILFSMEDQEGVFLVDTREGVVAGGVDYEFDDESPDDTEERFIPLPAWDSSDGYRLMERFAASFKNPLIREELTAALNQGKGVFRAFKDALGRYPEAEKRWFLYKEREMKREILYWYNGLREEWGLARIGGEPEETGELLLEDFRFRPGEERDSTAAADLHSLCLDEYTKEPGLLAMFPPAAFPGDVSLVAETGSGDFAGYLSANRRGEALYLTALEVRSEYRGLGVGEELTARLLAAAEADRTLSAVALELPAGTEGFSRVLLRESFKPCSTRYYLNLRDKTGPKS